MKYYLVIAIAILGPSLGATGCPGAEIDISPCTCSSKLLVCSGLTSAIQLKNIFSQTFPASSAFDVRVLDSVLGRLPDNVFGDKMISGLNIFNTTLSIPSALTFETTKPYMQTFYVYGNTVIDMLNLDSLGEALVSFYIYDSTVHNFKGDPFLPRLDIIHIIRNNLNHLPVLKRARSVTSITITNNSLKCLPANVFTNFPGLQLVDLAYNGLRSLSRNWLKFNSQDLTFLYIAHSNIAYIEPGALLGLRNTTDVYLGHNKLTTLEEDVFRPILAMTRAKVEVTGNPLVCDCSMAWLFKDPELLAKLTGGHCEVFGSGTRPFAKVDASIFSDC